MNKLLFSLPPVVSYNSTVLLLGSLPGSASLLAEEYYKHPRNQFWRLMSDVLDIDLVHAEYQQRLGNLLSKSVGIWDVVGSAYRTGSLDSAIRDYTLNDLLDLISTLPHLHAIAFNGGTASTLGLKLLGSNASRYTIIKLPSSSPAYTLPYETKLNNWLELRHWIHK